MYLRQFISLILFSILASTYITYLIYYIIKNRNRLFKPLLILLYMKQMGILSNQISLLYGMCFSCLDNKYEKQKMFKGLLIVRNFLGDIKYGYRIMLDNVNHVSEEKSEILIVEISTMKFNDKPFIKIDNKDTEYARCFKEKINEVSTFYNIKQLRKFNKLIKKNCYIEDIGDKKKKIFINSKLFLDGGWGENEKDIDKKMMDKMINKISKATDSLKEILESKKAEVENAVSGAREV